MQQVDYVTGRVLLRLYPVVFKASEAVTVKVGLTIHELIEVNMEKNSITAVFWFNYDWTDPFLSWKSKKKYAAVG